MVAVVVVVVVLVVLVCVQIDAQPGVCVCVQAACSFQRTLTTDQKDHPRALDSRMDDYRALACILHSRPWGPVPYLARSHPYYIL